VYGKTVKPGSPLSLKKFDTRALDTISKDEGKDRFAKYADELAELQELLYAAGTHSLLVVLQGMDTSGKDGAIKDVFREVNPAGCRVIPFKVPTPEELAHDFLWRVHKQVPERGQIAIFNRSHYEDVLVVRVHELAPKSVWSQRYDQINAFERLLADTGTIVVKCFLHISKEEQQERLLAREEDPVKAWKLAVKDWQERENWDRYQQAYQDALRKCSTDHAPWHIIPADQKWFRNLAISEILVTELNQYRRDWQRKLDALSKTQLTALKEARAAGAIPDQGSEARGQGSGTYARHPAAACRVA
jgi:PPK2 family polyphosphate:nucleotide phosphotransferase